MPFWLFPLLAGAVSRIGIPPTPRIANKLSHALQRGELLPTMASDAVVATIAKWFGLSTACSAEARFPDDPNHRVTSDVAIYNAFVALVECCGKDAFLSRIKHATLH